MKPVLKVLAVSMLALSGALCAQEPAKAPEAAPATTAAPAAPAAAPAAAPPAAPAPAVAAPPKIMYEALRIVVDGKAEYAGSVQFEVEPLGGPAKTVTVNVMAKEKEKSIAEHVYRELTIALGNAYKVKQSGADVKVKKASSKVANLSITIRQLQLSGVSVRVEKD
jgi:hypothetical protein